MHGIPQSPMSASTRSHTAAAFLALRQVLVVPGISALLTAACNQDPTGRGSGGVRERWFQQQGVKYSNLQPVVTGDAVLFGTGDGYLVARDRSTGVPRWAARIDVQEVGGATAILRRGIVVAPSVRRTSAVDVGTGRIIWSYEAPLDTVDDAAPAPGSVVLAHLDADTATVYIPAWGASVSAVDLRSGQARWVWRPGRTATDTAAAGVFRSGSMGVRVSGETVFATAWHDLVRNGQRTEAWLIALDRVTGAEQWRVTLPVVQMGVATSAKPALWGELVIVNTITGDLFAVDRSTGQLVWHVAPEPPVAGALKLATISSPAVAGDLVFHDGGNSHLYARRAIDGVLVWRSRYDGQIMADLTITATRLHAGNGGYLNIFERETGRRLHKLERPRSRTGGLFASSVAVVDGQAFVGLDGAAWSFVEP